MRFFNLKFTLIFSPLLILVTIACLEFVLLLRHKSPYLSDSYFYNHMFYRFQGYSHDEAYWKIIEKINVDKLSDVEKNIFFNPERYNYSLSRYIRRPLYPFFSYLVYPILKIEFLALITPIFVSFIGSVILIYLIFRHSFERFWATLGTALFIGFYPFIDWSTYFLTDTIGLFFWMLIVYLAIKYLETSKRKYLWIFVISFVLSLFNREQNVLIPIALAVILAAKQLFKIPKLKVKSFRKIFFISIGISLAYTLLNHILKQPNLYDSWIYLESNFGYYSKNYSSFETFKFLINQLIVLHKGLLWELIRHRWWTLITLLGFLGFFHLFIILKKPKLLDVLMVGSGIASYINLIIVPFLSYRYFYPSIISIIYFSLYTMKLLLHSEKTN